MKYTFHLKTADYSYIGGEMEGTAQEVVAAYLELQAAWGGGPGLSDREWCKLRDAYLATEQMDGDPGELEQLSKAQRWWVNETKKALKNIKRKNGGEAEE